MVHYGSIAIIFSNQGQQFVRQASFFFDLSQVIMCRRPSVHLNIEAYMKQRGFWLVLIAANLLILFVALPTAWSSPTRQSAPTPTSTATVFAEALNPDANIRNQPSINGDRIGNAKLVWRLA